MQIVLTKITVNEYRHDYPQYQKSTHFYPLSRPQMDMGVMSHEKYCVTYYIPEIDLVALPTHTHSLPNSIFE